MLSIFIKMLLPLCSGSFPMPKQLVGDCLLFSFISLIDDYTICGPPVIMPSGLLMSRYKIYFTDHFSKHKSQSGGVSLTT